jgi:hypothetical protein
MARKATSKPGSATSQSSATIGFEANFGPKHADTCRNVQHPDLRADFVIANALRDSASNPSKPNAADGKRPTTTFFKN